LSFFNPAALDNRQGLWPALLKIPEHSRRPSMAIEIADHTLLRVLDMILSRQLHAWKFVCWLASDVEDFGLADGG